MAFRPKKPITPEAALIKAEELCARAEHSSGEINDKLIKWGIIPNEAAKIIERLRTTRFIDDARFARAYARDKVEYSHWGKRKISLGLWQKRIARDIITEALDEIDQQRYEAALLTTIRSKARSLPDADSYEGRTKIFRHAVSRGFEPDLVARFLKAGLSR